MSLNVYEKLKIKRVINAAFPLTRIGGSRLSKEVLEVIHSANESYCSLWDLITRAGEIISDITRAEAGWVTSGAFSALVLSAAACIAGKDPEKMRILPDTNYMKNEIIIQRCNRLLVYDRSMEVAGGKFVYVGDERWGCSPQQIKAAITENTVAIHYAALMSPRPEVSPLEEVVEVAQEHNVPLIVDAAGMTWPLNELSRYTEMGCDLVCYGGKYVGGPNSTGFVIGKKDLIEAIALHSFIGAESGPDERWGYWRSIGRGYKLDRQEIVALIVALQQWVALDHEKVRFTPAWRKIHYLEEELYELEGLNGVRFQYVPKSGEGCGYHMIGLQLNFEDRTGAEVESLIYALRKDNPEIWVRYWHGENSFIINTLGLTDGEEAVIAKRFVNLFKE